LIDQRVSCAGVLYCDRFVSTRRIQSHWAIFPWETFVSAFPCWQRAK